MMPQMESNQPIYEQPGRPYGAYEGNRGSPQQQYKVPPQQSPLGVTLDENFVEAVSQRLSQLMFQQSTGDAYTQKSQDKPPHGMQLALGIISVIAVIPLAAICLAGVGGPGGLIGFLIGSSAIMCMNFAFNGIFDSKHRRGTVK